MPPFARVNPQVVAVEIPATRTVAVFRRPESTAVCFDDLAPLHGTLFIVPGPIIVQNYYLTAADGYFLVGKSA